MDLIFVDKKYILLDYINKLEGLDFMSLQLFVEMTDKIEIQCIVFKLYK